MLFIKRWTWHPHGSQRFQIDVLLSRGWRERCKISLNGSNEELNKLWFAEFRIGKEAYDAIGKARINAENG
jgi:hypothetical protein